MSTRPNYWWSLVTMKCPRCRRGKMFHKANPWRLRHVLSMPEKCPVCGQKFELETGFWYGTGYVSYALSIIVLIVGFVAWYIFIGMSIDDNRFFWWMGINIFLLLILQPWIMRLSRALYIYFFVRYSPNFKNESPREFS